MTPNTIEEELDTIRIRLYEETKGMSTSEVTAYIKKQLLLPIEECSAYKSDGSYKSGKNAEAISTLPR